MQNALGERGMWRGYRPPSRLAGLVEYRSYPTGVQGGASENDFGAFFYPRNRLWCIEFY